MPITANNKYMKACDPNRESYLMYWDFNDLYAVQQKLLADGFRWKKKKSKFNQKFIENYDDDSNKRHILGVDVCYPKCPQKMHSISRMFDKRLTNGRNLSVIRVTRKSMS